MGCLYVTIVSFIQSQGRPKYRSVGGEEGGGGWERNLNPGTRRRQWRWEGPRTAVRLWSWWHPCGWLDLVPVKIANGAETETERSAGRATLATYVVTIT